MNKELATGRCKGIVVKGKRRGKRCRALITYNTRYRTEPPQLCGSCDNLANETNYELMYQLELLKEQCDKRGLNFEAYKKYFLSRHDFSKKRPPNLSLADLNEIGEYNFRIGL